MVVFLIITISIILIWVGKRIFSKWINPISIYVIPWGIMLLLYDLKLLRYYELTTMTWFVVIAAFLSFFCGILLIKNTYKPKPFTSNIILIKNFVILKYLILIFGAIIIFDAIVHWGILLRMYGSIPGVFINANEIYRLRIAEKIPGILPYFNAFGYAGVFLSAVYSAFRGKISLISIIPLMGIVVKEIANVGRAGIFIALISYTITYFFTRNIVKENMIITAMKKSWRNQILGFIIVILLIVAGASVVRSVRGTYESFAGATKILSKTRGGLLITPSIYLYFSAHVGILNQFLKDENVDKDFGENTFLTLYSILSKFDLLERPSNYPKGYRIPMWSNTGTYLKEVVEDFGYAGIFIVPFLLGLLSAYFWFRLQDKKDMISLVLLSYTSILIAYSYVVMVTRLGLFTISITILILTSVIINRYEQHLQNK